MQDLQCGWIAASYALLAGALLLCLTLDSAWGILCDGILGVGHGNGSNARAQA